MPAPSAEEIRRGEFARTEFIDDLSLVRERVVDAIAGYQIVDWASEEENREVSLKSWIIGGTAVN